MINHDQKLIAECIEKHLENVPARESPVAELMNQMIVSAEKGKVVTRFELGEQFTQPHGAVQGGVLCMALDAGLAFGGLSVLAEGQSVITLNLDTRFLRPVFLGKVLVEASVDHAGKSIIFCSARLISGEQLCAKASATLKVIQL